MNKNISSACEPLKSQYDSCFKQNLQDQMNNFSKKGISLDFLLFSGNNQPHPCEELFDNYKTCVEVAMKLTIQKNKEAKS